MLYFDKVNCARWDFTSISPRVFCRFLFTHSFLHLSKFHSTMNQKEKERKWKTAKNKELKSGTKSVNILAKKKIEVTYRSKYRQISEGTWVKWMCMCDGKKYQFSSFWKAYIQDVEQWEKLFVCLLIRCMCIAQYIYIWVKMLSHSKCKCIYVCDDVCDVKQFSFISQFFIELLRITKTTTTKILER